MILTSGELIEFMEATPPEEWPAPRGYGYGNSRAGKRIKTWHLAVVREFIARMEAHRPHEDGGPYRTLRRPDAQQAQSEEDSDGQ